MRTTATCPKCSGKKIVVTELRHPASETGRIVPIPVAACEARSLFGLGDDVVGRFESWICAACGYTEFYAKDFGDVDKLAAKHSDDVRIVDGTIPARGPFR